MKGISEVVASLLILIITIGLAGLAYAYISGIFVSRTQTISLLDSYCNSTGDVTVILRNDGSSTVTGISVVPVDVQNCALQSPPSSISPGSTVTFTLATGCALGRTHTFRIVGPSNTLSVSAYCP